MKKLFLALFVVLLFTSAALSQTYKKVEIYVNKLTDASTLYKMGIDVNEGRFSKNNSFITYLNEKEFSKLQTSGFNYKVLIEDWNAYYKSLPVLTKQEKDMALKESAEKYGVTGFGYGSCGGFYTPAEMNAQLDSMRLLFPNLISAKLSIGTTTEGRPIYMVKVSNNPDGTDSKPEIIFTGMHHAREATGMAANIYFMWYLLQNYATNPSVKYLVDTRSIYFVPMLNVDGYTYNISTNPSGGGMWRKNRKNNGDGTYGIDINRNYGPYAYWNSSNGGSSTSTSDETYRGTAPFSELETQTIKNFLAAHSFKTNLNYHTYGGDLIYPYGALDYETPDSLMFREFAMDITAMNGYIYGTDMQCVGYATRGGADDYFYDGDTVANHGKIISMTPEIGTDFWPPQSEIIPDCEMNLGPNLYMVWVTGDYVKLTNAGLDHQYYNPGETVTMHPVLKNKGLSNAAGISVELTALTTNATVVNGTAAAGNINARSTYTFTSPLSFSISSAATVESTVKMLLTVKSGSVVMSADTIALTLGVPSFAFNDTTNNVATYFTVSGTPAGTNWEATNLSYHSSPTSYTDSKNGSYPNNCDLMMTLTSPLDLSGLSTPRLTYWTKWEIEADWDYAQVKVSTNNGSTWTALAGAYTHTGGSHQVAAPLYDGTQSSWVREDINISQYKSNQFKIRFELKSDGSQTKDGWYVDDIGIYVYSVTPVELTSFIGGMQGSEAVLNWSTATELNNKGFEVERGIKKDGRIVYTSLGFVQGSGTSQQPANYKFTDKEPASGLSYYRIKQIDFDGSYRIYGPLEISNQTVDSYSLQQNYPNPFNPSTNIRFSISQPGLVTLQVFDILGKEVYSSSKEYQQAGSYTINMDASKLSSGTYFYKLTSGKFTETKKMQVLK
jgi:hypothetical protein